MKNIALTQNTAFSTNFFTLILSHAATTELSFLHLVLPTRSYTNFSGKFTCCWRANECTNLKFGLDIVVRILSMHKSKRKSQKQQTWRRLGLKLGEWHFQTARASQESQKKSITQQPDTSCNHIQVFLKSIQILLSHITRQQLTDLSFCHVIWLLMV